MAKIVSVTHPQPDILLTPVPDFIEQARACEQIASVLGESHDSARNQALCNQLHACLTQLQPGLLDPIPTSLIERFTVDTLPAESAYFDADCTELCRYCMALSAVLGKQQTDSGTERTLRDLLCHLTAYFVEGMMAPRWVRGTKGVEKINYA